MKQKLSSKRKKAEVVVSEEEQRLEQCILKDKEALNHQRYLIEGVLRQFTAKKLTYQTASRGLLKTNTEKWLKARDTGSEAAIGMSRGAYFGNSRPVKRTIQSGMVIPVTKSFNQLKERSSLRQP